MCVREAEKMPTGDIKLSISNGMLLFLNQARCEGSLRIPLRSRLRIFTRIENFLLNFALYLIKVHYLGAVCKLRHLKKN